MNRDIDDAEQARVNNQQPLLIPATPRELCKGIGLDWWAALKLWDDKHLSFNPETTAHLNDAQHAELVFLGALVSGGCEPAFLKQLLAGLTKPYAYSINLIYFDWLKRQWRLIPQTPSRDEMEKIFSALVNELEEAEDVETLQQMAAHIENSLHMVVARQPDLGADNHQY